MNVAADEPVGTPSRGHLRVYLGAAPGVGKTYAMLAEGQRRAARGKDVVIGLVETHGRPLTAEIAVGLEQIPRRELPHRGATLSELDVAGVLARHPQVALVDELAHTNAPGSVHPKRWQDIDDLLDAGIDVITTVNIQHLESLNDVVESITGIRQAETVPDDVVRRADQIELVDMSPQALRRRMAHGNIYQADRIDAALSNYFREGNLTALRELALLWTADRVDDALERYRTDNDIGDPWPTRERVVVGLAGGPEGETLLRRGARITSRAAGGELLALHVSAPDGLLTGSAEALARQRLMVEELGGTFHQVTGTDVATALLEFARAVNASQVVLGAPRRGRWSELLARGVGARVVRDSGDIDVHIVTLDDLPSDRHRPRRRSLSQRRRGAGWVLTFAGLPLLTWAMVSWTDTDTLPVVLMIYLSATLAIALLGGMVPAVTAAVLSAALANYFFIPPLHTWHIAAAPNIIAIVLLLAVAVAAARVVDVSARRMQEASRARAEADVLTTLTGSILHGDHAIMALLVRLQESFSLGYVALRERQERSGRWRTVESVGAAPQDPTGLTAVPISGDLELTLAGAALSTEDMRVLTAVAVQADTLMERDRLRTEARLARRERDRAATRTALLAAVSHDLRTPLAGIKAGVTSLRSNDAVLSPDDRAELLTTVADSTERLQSLVDNLLDMSRLDAGAVRPMVGEVWLPDVIAAAARDLDPARLHVNIPIDLPPAFVDEGLLERALANVLENAVRFSPEGVPVEVNAAIVGRVMVVRVADRGPGVPPDQRDRIFEAFQRLGDAPRSQGVGLGLAVARGFVEAVGGTIEAEDTPAGGLTMLIRLPTAAAAAAEVAHEGSS